jgi:hypothetical protein
VPHAFVSPPSDPWILRRLIACRKTPQGNPTSNWSQDPIPVRFGPYVTPRPAGRLTEWRAVRAAAGSHIFILTLHGADSERGFPGLACVGRRPAPVCH